MIKNIKNKPRVGRPRKIIEGRATPLLLYLDTHDTDIFSEICREEGTSMSADVRKYIKERIEKKALGLSNPLNTCITNDLNSITLPLIDYMKPEEAEKCISDYIKSDEKLNIIRQACKRVSEHANSKLTKRYTMLRWD